MKSVYDSTIVIPTYERPVEIKKLVKYLDEYFDFTRTKVIVLDGSDKSADLNEGACKGTKVEYRHYDPSIPYLERLLEGLNSIETDITLLLGDDDIINPICYNDCVEFLKNNKDYTVAHGRYMGFDWDNNGLRFNETYIAPSYEQDTCAERLFAYFSSNPPIPTLYAVNRTSHLKACFQDVKDYNIEFKDYISWEALSSAVPLVFGKIKRFDTFYYARRSSPPYPDKYLTYYKYILDEEFFARYSKLKKLILKYVEPNSDLKKVSDSIDCSLAAFYCYAASNEIHSVCVSSK